MKTGRMLLVALACLGAVLTTTGFNHAAEENASSVAFWYPSTNWQPSNSGNGTPCTELYGQLLCIFAHTVSDGYQYQVSGLYHYTQAPNDYHLYQCTDDGPAWGGLECVHPEGNPPGGADGSGQFPLGIIWGGCEEYGNNEWYGVTTASNAPNFSDYYEMPCGGGRY